MLNRTATLCVASLVFSSQIVLASGGHVIVARNTVIPVVFQEQLSVKDNRVGDRFLTTVRDDRDFPRGTHIEGRVVEITPKGADRPASMDLEFTRVLFPDGTKAPVRAVPIRMDLKEVTRTRDGHYTVNPKAADSDKYVLGGLLGGTVLGSLINKPFEGAFLGTLAGIIAAETNRNQNGDVVIARGAQMGALFKEDFQLDSAVESHNSNGDERGDAPDRRPIEGRTQAPVDSGDIRISLDGHDLIYSKGPKPFRDGDSVLVPLDRTADQLGLTVEKLGEGSFLLESDDSMMRVEQDSQNYRLNGKRGTFSHPVVAKDGVAFVPVEILSMMNIGHVAVNGTNIEKPTLER